MPYIEVAPGRCKGCELCVENCPKHILQLGKDTNQSGYNTVVQISDECTGCTLCAVVCPDMAISVFK